MKMKRVAVGSKNPAKVHAVQDILIAEKVEVISIKAESHVSAQPFSDEETREGAINRSKEALQLANSDFGIGLEGGVYKLGEQLFLCNWGALITKNEEIYVASGLRLPLPNAIANQLYDGLELSEALQIIEPELAITNGAVGYLTGNYISRKAMFAEVVKACYGQYIARKSNVH
ncbi:DUF84 family protein [Bacillus sp. JCM 19041]|uniref:DUF84 family protein n=1 Tax=Bacillus sp. JCM 19041 TaxID=1460637 RepID=UPI0009E6A7D3